jgi:hypothetical protein
MNLFECDKQKIKILTKLYNLEKSISMNGLRIKVGKVNFISIQRNCEFLEKSELIKIDKIQMEGEKRYNLISITNRGKTIYETIKKNGN